MKRPRLPGGTPYSPGLTINPLHGVRGPMAKHVYIIVAGLALAVAMVFVVLTIGAYVLQPIPVH